MRWTCLLLAWLAMSVMPVAPAQAQSSTPAPVAAVFPLGGDAPADQRDQVGFGLRAKLKRDGTYAPIDGPTMAAAAAPVDAATDAAVVRRLSAALAPAVILWGELDATDGGPKLVLNLLDLRPPAASPQRFERVLAQPTDLRFALDDALKMLPGFRPSPAVSETAVSNDPALAARFARNPNLLPAADFSSPAAWRVLLAEQSDPPADSATLPQADTAAIVPAPADAGMAPGARVLAMRLSKSNAEEYGLACLSSSAAVTAGLRYRLSFRFWSDGPEQHVFVKGYTGSGAGEREVYRRQVPPSGATDGKWQTVVCDLTPQGDGAAVQSVRVDLYVYFKEGLAMFGDVQLKAVGEPATNPAH